MHFLTSKKGAELFLISLIVIYPWVFNVFQGLYIPELGYWLVSYENFFSNPEVSQTTFYSWLTTFFGAVVDYFVGSWGVVGYKAANVFLIYLILYFVYKLLVEFSEKYLLLYCLLVVEITVNSYNFINYYALTTLFFIVSSFCLYKGLSRNNLLYFFAAGIFLSLNIFVRFPNILGIGLIIVILYYHYGQDNRDYRHMLKQAVVFLLGYIAAIIAVLLVMKMLGHYDLYIQNITELFAMSKGDTTYNSSRMIGKYFIAQLYAVKNSIVIFVGIFFLLVVKKFNTNNKILNNYLLSFLLIVVSVFMLIKVSKVEYVNYLPIFYGVFGFLYIVLLWIAFTQLKKNTNFGLIALLAFLIFEIIPFASATVLYQAKFGIYLAVPPVFVYLFSLKRISIRSLSFERETIRYIGIIMGIVLIAYSLIATTVCHPPGLEVKKRWSLTYGVDDSRLKANFMSEEKAKTLSELLENMRLYSKGLSYILTYEQISTINYLSRLQPYLNNTYPFFMRVDKLKSELKYQQKNKTLPMIVRAKSVATQKGWPKSARQIDVTKGSKNHIEMRAIFEKFIKKHNYVSVWKNEDFEILIPKIKENNYHEKI